MSNMRLMTRLPGRRVAAAFLAAALASACQTGSQSEEPAEIGTIRPDPTSSPASRPSSPSAAASVARLDPLPVLYELEPGTLAEVVTDDLVLRSAPGVADDSLILPGELNAPTRVYVRGGPVEADGYEWFLVDAIAETGDRAFVVLEDSVYWQVSGWAAAAGKDGEQWLAPLGHTAGEWAVSNSQALEYRTDLRHAAVGPDDRLYAFGGLLDDTGTPSASAWAYDPGAGWQPIASMPTARHHPLVAVRDELIYVIGGYNTDGALAVVEIYDPTLDRWHSGPPLPKPEEFGSAAATAPDGSIYVFGREGVWTHPPSGSAWRLVTDSPIPADDAVTMADGTMYVLDSFGAIRSFDPATAALGPLNLPRMTRSNATLVATPDAHLLVVGGWWSGGPCLIPDGYEPDIEDYARAVRPPPVESFDPATRTWLTFAPLPHDLIPISTVLLDGHVAVIGSRVPSVAESDGLLQASETVVALFDTRANLAADGRPAVTAESASRGCGDYF